MPTPAHCSSESTANITVAFLSAKKAGTGVDLSNDDLRRRFAAEWNACTTHVVVVELKLFYHDNSWSSPVRVRARGCLSFQSKRGVRSFVA
jgi:hypothetical protein